MRGAPQPGLAADGGLDAYPVLVERAHDLGVVLGPRKGVEVHDGLLQLTVDGDLRDRHHVEPGVVEAGQLLGDDLAQQLADAGGAGAVG